MGSDRESPPFVLEYSSFTKRVAALHATLIVVFAALFVAIVGGAFLAESALARAGYRASAVLYFVLLAGHGFVYWRMVRPMARTRIFLYADRFEVDEGKRRFVARFEEIAAVYGRVFPHFGGNFGVVLKSRATYGFSATLPGAERILEAIGDRTPALRPELAELVRNLVVAQHGFARLAEYFRGPRGFFTAIHAALVPFVFTAILVGRQGRAIAIPDPTAFFGHTLVGIYAATLTLAVFFAFVLNRVIDAPTLERLRDRPRERARNLFRERRILRDATPVYLFGLFSILALYQRYDLNLLSRTILSADVPHLGLSVGQILWIDERANRLEGRHALAKGDLVVFERDGSPTLGRLVGLPGGPAELLAPTELGRRPASSAVVVPYGKVAVQSNPDGDRIELVDVANLRGRAADDLRPFLRARN